MPFASSEHTEDPLVSTYVTVRPLDAEASNINVGSVMRLRDGWGNVIAWLIFPTSIRCTTDVAASYKLEPACDAVTSHTPEPTKVTVDPLLLHAVPSPAVMTRLTTRPALEVAVGVYVSLETGLEGGDDVKAIF